ncbi:MAG: hypothetical protein CL566_06710 [Alphaproteobacteria bacterium]|nr:hypothetical protein [Alphaproteobacteria bacterium]|tara:strand:- start:162 stop:353 length:192 start_codon:yes stop_codon:yes gene_type:complete
MASTAELDRVNCADGVRAIASDTGIPGFNRRLSDKVLAAVNHAYAVGELDVAAGLREVVTCLD